MTFALLAHLSAASTNSNGFTSGSIDTTGANLLVVGVVSLKSPDPVLTDSNGNTWTALTNYNGSTPQVTAYYCYAPTVGAGHTFTVTLNASYVSIEVLAFSGSASSPFDVENGAGTDGTSQATGSITPSENNELIVSFLGMRDTGTLSIDNGMTIAGTSAYSANNMGCASAYKFQTTAAAINPTWSWTPSKYCVATVMAFKAAAGDTTAPVLTSPTGTQTGSTTGSGTVTTDEANGTLYSWATTNATETVAAIKTNGATQTVTATGSQGVTFTGLSPSTTYYAHYVHRDAAGNDSTASNSSSFTTTAGGGSSLFRNSPGASLSGLGSGGKFFQNPLG